LRPSARPYIIGAVRPGRRPDRYMSRAAIIMGTGAAAQRLARALGEDGPDVFALGDYVADVSALRGRLAAGDVAAVLVAEAGAKDDALRAVAAAWNAGADACVAAELLPELAAVAAGDDIGGNTVIPFPREGRGPGYRLGKWLLDKFVAAAFIIILTPVWLPMFVAIKLDSKGPIVFRQKRLGRGRREFNIYKFRTMFATVPKYQSSPAGDDIRITRVGRILRRLGLDETAQLINVIKGQMSLVGPRPEMALVAASYEGWESFRFAVRPGITGLWQVAGRADRPIRESLEFDLYYLATRTLALDVRILARTVPILFGKGGHH